MSGDAERHSIRLERLKPPPRHRKQPDDPREQVFQETQAHNRRRGLVEKYRRKYAGRHRKED